MKWIRLIGKRILDFIITSSAILVLMYILEFFFPVLEGGILIVVIGLCIFGVISIFGIVFRREGLTQREGFIRIWGGVPKYLAGYFNKTCD